MNSSFINSRQSIVTRDSGAYCANRHYCHSRSRAKRMPTDQLCQTACHLFQCFVTLVFIGGIRSVRNQCLDLFRAVNFGDLPRACQEFEAVFLYLVFTAKDELDF